MPEPITGSVSQLASAALVVSDYQTVGDGLITYDTDTGLRWLDIPVTFGLSSVDGFRQAKVTELIGLYRAAGISCISGVDGDCVEPRLSGKDQQGLVLNNAEVFA